MFVMSQRKSVASRPSRRQFLATSLFSGLAVGQCTLGQPVLAADRPIRLKTANNTDLFRVRMEMDVKGNVHLAKDPMIPDSPKQVLPITAKMVLDYEERYLRPSGASADSEVIAAERHYYEATGNSRLNRTDQNTELRSAVGSVIARREELPESIYSQADYLTAAEVELLRTPVSSVAIDRLVPERALRSGESAEVDAEVLASVLNLSNVVASDVQMELVSIDGAQAKLQMRGKLDGSVAGVPTELRVLGKLTLDRQTNTVSWAAIAIHETREIGKAEPGFDVTATIRMIRKPVDRAQKLARTPAKVDFNSEPPTERMLMSVNCDHAGVSALMDRRWRIMKDAPGESVLRMIENDDSIAQLNLRTLPRLGEGEQWTLEAFEQDVKRTLGERFTDIIQSQEGVTDGGLRMLRVVAAGAVQGVPIQWIMMHFSDDDQRRVVATLTMDGESAARLGGADIQLAASLQLTRPAGNVAGDAAGRDGAPEKQGVLKEKLSNNATSQLESTASVRSPSDGINR